MKRTLEFRQLQQLVLTKQRRGLKLNSPLELKMADYIENSQNNKKQLDEVASVIEEEILKHNNVLMGVENENRI